jgi:cbb3-type cytochrome oxidase subunit 3
MKSIKVFVAILILSSLFMSLTAQAYHSYSYRSEWNAPSYNSLPRWDSQAVKYAHVGQKLTFTVSATDPDGDRLAYHGMFLPIGARFDSQSRTFSWTPRKTGTYDLQFRVYDGGYSHSDLVVTTIVGNQLPLFNNLGSANNTPSTSGSHLNFVNFNPPSVTKENQLYTYTVQTRSSHKVTYSLPNAPQGMTINPELGIIIWLPNQNQAQLAPYFVTVKATNGYQDAQLNYNLTVNEGGAVTVQPTPGPTPQPTPAPVSPAQPADDKEEDPAEEVESDEDKKGFLASMFIAGIGFIFSPWFLLLLTILLFILLFIYYKKNKEKKQLIALMEEKDKKEDDQLEE